MTSSTTPRAAAYALAAAFLLLPANLLPVMYVAQVGGPIRDATILSGVRLLAGDGLWGLALIVFTASVLVPLLKLVGMAFLLQGVRRPTDARRALRLSRLHSLLDRIGRWSMLDVFLVAFLSGAVRFGRFATAEPRPGILAFAAVVVLTMLATRAFDPRELWRGPAASAPSLSVPHD